MDAKTDKRARENGRAPRPRVIKFGGTSVTGGDRIDTIAAAVSGCRETARPVVVVSAFAQVTTLLERAALAAETGEYGEVFGQLRAIHEDAVRSMTDSASALCATVEGLLTALGERLDRIASAGECSIETLDDILSFGERLSSAIITRGLVGRGISARAIDASELVVTDANFGDARADLEATRSRLGVVLSPTGAAAACAAVSVAPPVPVVTGFIGATPAGVRTTLGREGSDYSAAVLAWGLRAEAVEIWTDVDGIMTADPHVVPDARPLRHLTYDELLELTSWGAKVVHPKTVRPLRDLGIVLAVRNTLAPEDPGTRVGEVGRRPERHGPLGVTRIDSVALHGMSTQGDQNDFEEEKPEALGRLREFDEPYAVVTAVGDRLLPGVSDALDRLGEVLARGGVSVHAVVEGASGRSISYVVRPNDGDVVVRALHQALFGHGVAPDEEQRIAVDRRESDAVHA